MSLPPRPQSRRPLQKQLLSLPNNRTFAIESVSTDTKPAPAEPAAALNLSAAAVLQPQPLPAPLSATVTGNKDASVKPVGDASSSKLHVSTISDQSVSPTPAQTTTTGGNQGQSSNPQPDQNATPAPAISLGHTSTTLQDHNQIPATAVPSQTAVPPTEPAAHATKPALPAAPNGSALPEPAPVVNTARLIQTATQSEMRVGCGRPNSATSPSTPALPATPFRRRSLLITANWPRQSRTISLKCSPPWEVISEWMYAST